MSKLKVLITVRSNKIQAKVDGIHYKTTFDDNNHYQVSFEGYVLENSKLRFSNIDPKEQFPVQRLSDNEIIWCYYNQFSNFVIEEDGSGGEDASTLNGQAGSYYLNRSNHTGTQLASTISDFQNQVSLNTDVLGNTTDRHTHSNKSILDDTTAAFLIADKNKLDTIEENATVGADWDTNLINKPILGTASSADINDFATAAQGALADSALQSFTESDPTVPAHVKGITSTNISSWNAKLDSSDISSVGLSGDYGDLINIPTTFVPSAHQHNASDINAGTLSTDRIPQLDIVKITDLQTNLDGKQSLLTSTNAGTDIVIDVTDPNNPVINNTFGKLFRRSAIAGASDTTFLVPHDMSPGPTMVIVMNNIGGNNTASIIRATIIAENIQIVYDSAPGTGELEWTILAK